MLQYWTSLAGFQIPIGRLEDARSTPTPHTCVFKGMFKRMVVLKNGRVLGVGGYA